MGFTTVFYMSTRLKELLFQRISGIFHNAAQHDRCLCGTKNEDDTLGDLPLRHPLKPEIKPNETIFPVLLVLSFLVSFSDCTLQAVTPHFPPAWSCRPSQKKI